MIFLAFRCILACVDMVEASKSHFDLSAGRYPKIAILGLPWYFGQLMGQADCWHANDAKSTPSPQTVILLLIMKLIFYFACAKRHFWLLTWFFIVDMCTQCIFLMASMWGALLWGQIWLWTFMPQKLAFGVSSPEAVQNSTEYSIPIDYTAGEIWYHLDECMARTHFFYPLCPETWILT